MLKRSRFWMPALCLAVIMAADTVASEVSPPDAVRIARLAGVCRLWGAVRYFHPYLAYQDIGWDAALIGTLPKIDAAKSPDDYKSAVAHLISFLKDPNTRILDESTVLTPAKITDDEPNHPYLRWADDSIAVIVAADYEQFDGSPLKADQLTYLIEKSRHARGIVFDIRRRHLPAVGLGFDAAPFRFRLTFTQALQTLLQHDVPLPSSRHLMHAGYTPQAGPSTGAYYSAFIYPQTGTVAATGQEFDPIPIVFVINESSGVLIDVLGGLQAAGRAVMVYEGYFNLEAGIDVHRMTLPDGIEVEIRTSQIVRADGTEGVHPDLVIPTVTDTTLLASPVIKTALNVLAGNQYVPPVVGLPLSPSVAAKGDKSYDEMVYPPAEYRLLALFRFWTIIQYFYPHLDDLDTPWDSVLHEFIPEMEAAADSLEYVLTVARLVGRLRDSHGNIRSPIWRHFVGVFYPPIEIRQVEGMTVVTYVSDDPEGQAGKVQAGDLILAVNGEPVEESRERLAEYLSASTPQAMRRKLDRLLLGGRNLSDITLTVRGADGQTADVVLKRTLQFVRLPRLLPVMTVLPEGFGYIDLDRLTVAQVDSAMQRVKDTPGLIFDMRGYPNGTAWPLAPYLARDTVPATEIRIPIREGPDPYQWSVAVRQQMVRPRDGWTYTGDVVVLIDETTVSQAEHTCLYLEAAADVTFIGTATDGADGNVTSAVLPGGITVNFTGMDVRYPDCRPLQRVGIQPDVEAAPTVEGIRNGRDEILDAAVAFLKAHTGG